MRLLNKTDIFNKNVITIGIILLAALIIRIIFFLGYGLGDDHIIVSLTRMLSENFQASYNYGPGYRFGILGPTALFFNIFGINNFSYTLIIMISSLGSIIMVYLIGKNLFNEKTGQIAAVLLAICPFDAVFASSGTNDITVSFAIAAAFYFFIKGNQNQKKYYFLIYYFVASLFMMWAYYVKLPAILTIFVFGVISLVNIKQFKKHFFFYAFVSIFLSATFLADHLITGDFLNRLHKIVHDIPKPGPFSEIWSWYPRWMFLPHIYTRNTYLFGFSFYLGAIGLIYCTIRKIKKSYTILLWFTVLFLLLEFIPQGFSLPYKLSYRFFRHTHAFLIPAIILASIVLADLFIFLQKLTLSKSVPRFLKRTKFNLSIAHLSRKLSASFFVKKLFSHITIFSLIAVLLFITIIGLSLKEGYKIAELYQNGFREIQNASKYVKKLPQLPVYSDFGMVMGYEFFTQYKRSHQVKHQLKQKSFQFDVVQDKNYSNLKYINEGFIITGGARRPDLGIFAVFNPDLHHIPKNWKLLKQFDKPITIYRLQPLRIYQVLSTPEDYKLSDQNDYQPTFITAIDKQTIRKNVLIDNYHGKTFQTFTTFLIENGYNVTNTDTPLTAIMLNEYSCIILTYHVDWNSFSKEELALLGHFFQQGGRLLMMGISWTYDGKHGDEFPYNNIISYFDLQFSQYITSDKKLYFNKNSSITKSLKKTFHNNMVYSGFDSYNTSNTILLYDQNKKGLAWSASKNDAKAVVIGHCNFGYHDFISQKNVKQFIANSMQYLSE